jgi:poly-gamma-glutamate synthesis protein (capsule biosynthesis protein)
VVIGVVGVLAGAGLIVAGHARAGANGAGDTSSPNGRPTALLAADEPTTSPTATPSAAATAGAARVPTGAPITLDFGGDVHFAGSAAVALDGFGPITDTLKSADLAMVNLETAVTSGGAPEDKDYTFRAPAQAFTALRAAGISVVTMANNHGMDYGPTGLQDTISAARAAGFPVIGIGENDTEAFRPYRAVIHGQRVSIIAATRVLDTELQYEWTAGPNKPGLASAKDMTALLAAVRAARADSDTVVVFLHWGVEGRACPGTDQTGIVPALVAAGADIVVGSHAHVREGEGWGPTGAFVDYGLGNFVFYASGAGPTTDSGVLRLTVQGRAVTQAQWVPAHIVGALPRPLTGAAAQANVTALDQLRQCAGLSATAPVWSSTPVS